MLLVGWVDGNQVNLMVCLCSRVKNKSFIFTYTTIKSLVKISEFELKETFIPKF